MVDADIEALGLVVLALLRAAPHRDEVRQELMAVAAGLGVALTGSPLGGALAPYFAALDA